MSAFIEDLRNKSRIGSQLEQERFALIRDLEESVVSVLRNRGRRKLNPLGIFALSLPPVTIPITAVADLAVWPIFGFNPIDSNTKKVFSTNIEDGTHVTVSSYNADLKRTPLLTVEVDGVSKLTIAKLSEAHPLPAEVNDYNPDYKGKWRFFLKNKWLGNRNPTVEELTTFKLIVESIS